MNAGQLVCVVLAYLTLAVAVGRSLRDRDRG